ncbi:MAG: nitroreductase family protein [Armatimonadetes bacterium]|jgi:nitroreductase|nr:nitroreductase family protein [Armatimonadota bacterium]
MEAMQAILSRRSIRQFTNQPVSDDLVEQLLRAAMSAPSAGNQQPWQFVVVTDRAILEAIPTIHPHAAMSPMAALGILVCGDLNREVYRGYWPQDCAAAIENLLVAANALGLGAVWTGIYPVEERVAQFREKFGIPEEIVPMAWIPIGWPAETKEPADRYDPARIHRERW